MQPSTKKARYEEARACVKETSSAAALWEVLFARGFFPSSWWSDGLRGFRGSRRHWIPTREELVLRWRTTPRAIDLPTRVHVRPQLWTQAVLFAADAEELPTVEALALEGAARLAPWLGGVTPKRVLYCFGKSVAQREGLLGYVQAALQNALPGVSWRDEFASTEQETRTLWNMVSERGLVVPEVRRSRAWKSMDVRTEGMLFSELRDPLEVFDALWNRGYGFLNQGPDAVVLACRR